MGRNLGGGPAREGSPLLPQCAVCQVSIYSGTRMASIICRCRPYTGVPEQVLYMPIQGGRYLLGPDSTCKLGPPSTVPRLGGRSQNWGNAVQSRVIPNARMWLRLAACACGRNSQTQRSC